MGIIKKSEPKTASPEVGEKSIYISNVKIDRSGEGWSRKAVWIRQEHLGKLKAIAHFEGKEVDELIDVALQAYVSQKWDSSMAVKKLVEQSVARTNKNGGK
ncbi:MAG: hypothetical protein JW763_06875 [candidate division Zixibacteria bacterium]|nr:hypothetical protein [candidate division Zixibacteria bacterium]